MKLWRAAGADDAGAAELLGPVTVRGARTLVVACGSGTLSLLELQCRAGAAST